MKYDVIISRCGDPTRAALIARKIAGWAGMNPEEVFTIITKQNACIRKSVQETTARRLADEYEKLGARVEVRTAVESEPGAAGTASASDTDDEEEVQGRVLSDEEYCAKVNGREDIFYFEGTKRVRNMELVALLCAVAAGAFLSTREFETIAQQTDFYEKETRVVTFIPPKNGVDRPKPRHPEKQEVQVSERRTLKQTTRKGSGGVTGGGGDPRARVTKQGVLGIVAGAIKGKSVAGADIFGKGGFASEIDAVLSGLSGLKSGGSGGVGRRGEAGMGFGTGYGSGFGGGSGGVGDLLSNLMASDEGGIIKLKNRGRLVISKPTFATGGSLPGGRSKASIMKVVMQNIAALRYAYNKRLREKPGLKGKVTVKFAIDEFGKVIFCSMEESTMQDRMLETLVVSKIRAWKFDKIDKPGDVTEVVYPFVFSQ